MTSHDHAGTVPSRGSITRSDSSLGAVTDDDGNSTRRRRWVGDLADQYTQTNTGQWGQGGRSSNATAASNGTAESSPPFWTFSPTAARIRGPACGASPLLRCRSPANLPLMPPGAQVVGRVDPVAGERMLADRESTAARAERPVPIMGTLNLSHGSSTGFGGAAPAGVASACRGILLLRVWTPSLTLINGLIHTPCGWPVHDSERPAQSPVDGRASGLCMGIPAM